MPAAMATHRVGFQLSATRILRAFPGFTSRPITRFIDGSWVGPKRVARYQALVYRQRQLHRVEAISLLLSLLT